MPALRRTILNGSILFQLQEKGLTLNSRPQKLSYLKLGVVGRDVGVVVPAGGHAEEKDLLSCSVVIAKEPFCISYAV